MKRSVNCIRMLQLLKARGFLSREALADLLHTNIRNISEYRKELQEAGYVIESTRGKHGGYRLTSGALFPVIALQKAELQAVMEARRYIHSHRDFLMEAQFMSATDKLLATTSLREDENSVYMQSDTPSLSAALRAMLQRMETAKKDHLAIDIRYRGMHASTFETVRVFPYELLNDKGSYYCLGYSLKAKAFRKFKFSEERMQQINITSQAFVRDPAFRLQEHIGEMGVISQERYALELLVWGENALLLKEKQTGIHVTMQERKDGMLAYRCIMEGRIPTLQFLLSLGTQAVLLSPVSLREEMSAILTRMQQNYQQAENLCYNTIQESVEK